MPTYFNSKNHQLVCEAYALVLWLESMPRNARISGMIVIAKERSLRRAALLNG